MTTATIETESPPEPRVPATLFVPVLPVPRDLSNDFGRDAFRRWRKAIATYARLNRVGPIGSPVRVVATVRIADDRRRRITDASLPRWGRGVRDGLDRSGLVPPSLLRGVEVRFEPLEGVDLLVQPVVTGTEFTFIEEGE